MIFSVPFPGHHLRTDRYPTFLSDTDLPSLVLPLSSFSSSSNSVPPLTQSSEIFEQNEASWTGTESPVPLSNLRKLISLNDPWTKVTTISKKYKKSRVRHSYIQIWKEKIGKVVIRYVFSMSHRMTGTYLHDTLKYHRTSNSI